MRIPNLLPAIFMICAAFPFSAQSLTFPATKDFLFVAALPGQDSLGPTDAGPTTSGQSDPQAVAVVQTAIKAMGGIAAWNQVGGATAQVIITHTNLPPHTVNWADDWSKSRVRFRRDSAETGMSQSSIIRSDESQAHLTSNGKLENLPHDNGIAALAMSYPAPALILSLSSKNGCTFHLGKRLDPRAAEAEGDPDDITITEICSDPNYPSGSASLIWVFSQKSGAPKTVELPVWGILHHIIRTQTVRFLSFQAVDSKLTPSELQIQRTTGQMDMLTISQTSFVQSIPDQTFQSPK